MKSNKKSLVKEKHRDAMRSHRIRNKQAGRIEMRLGWGSIEERAALQAILEGLRNPATAGNAGRLIADLQSVINRGSSNFQMGGSKGDSNEQLTEPTEISESVASMEALTNPAAQTRSQPSVQSAISKEDLVRQLLSRRGIENPPQR